MPLIRWFGLLLFVFLTACGGGGGSEFTLTVGKTGTGSGTVTSTPAGINCGETCAADFSAGSQVTLTMQPASASTFAGWGGACGGSTCAVTMDTAKSVTATFEQEAAPPPPPPPPGGISGTVLAPPGGDVAGSRVIACFPQGDGCNQQRSRTFDIQQSGSSASYAFAILEAGQYIVFAGKDVDGSGGAPAEGDYRGVHDCDSLEDCQPTAVTPPAQNIDIQLLVIGGGGDTGALTFLRPADFQNGAATLTLNNLTGNERVAVIPVYATQDTDPDALSYSVNVQGVSPQALESLAVSRPLSEEQELRLEFFHNRVRLLEENNELVSRLLQAGVKPLPAGEITTQAFDKCPGPYTVGSKECQFWVSATSEQEQITATLRYESASAYWFIQNEDLGDFSDADLQGLAQIYEDTLVPSNRRYFGEPADIDGNGKVFLLFSRLLGPRGISGYVSGLDFFPDDETVAALGRRSNEADIFYAATPSSLSWVSKSDYLQTLMPATMVHELKHLIAYSVRLPIGLSLEESWWEEGSAQAAQELAGYGSQIGDMQPYASRALAAPQSFRLAYKDRGELSEEEQLTMYGYNFLMLWRVAEKVGHDAFWKSWTAGPKSGVANLEAHSNQPFPELMLDFATTLMFDNTGLIEGYDYASLNLRDGSWEPLGYSALSSTQGAARSMAYYLGTGTGGNATITVQSQHPSPYAVVVRYPLDAGASQRSQRGPTAAKEWWRHVPLDSWLPSSPSFKH